MKRKSKQYANEKALFDALVQAANILSHSDALAILEREAHQSTGVCRTSYRHSYGGQDYTEELVIDFESGTCIIATLVSDVYFWEFIPTEGQMIERRIRQ